ncbi:copper resistance CopC family protein [Aeromicrobium sp. Leaf350]|uniref:copper resistance CopC family protein n=1 Tax=Aeromicrobium sp. Leaf350 TaxID=2876565 RepID=UPI001E31729C|nr:copper resistance CopC family protein [Aeromicrobium sp. Leaf350]
MIPVRRRLLPALPALVAVVAVLVMAGSTSASAHAGLVSTNPGERSSVEAMPSAVRLTFNETMNRPSYVVVKAPDGAIVAEGEATVDGADLVQTVDDPGLAGTYRVDYRAISADGHPVEGAFEFDVTSGAEVESSPVEKVTSSTWTWVGLVALPWLALVGLLLMRRRKVDA